MGGGVSRRRKGDGGKEGGKTGKNAPCGNGPRMIE